MNARALDALRSRLPAVAALAVLVAVIATGGIDAEAPANADAYFDETAAAINGTSTRIGNWNGQPNKVSPAADELLKPNAILQRTYEDGATGRTYNLLLVHCRDARDMDGHYPPICYKNAGYRLESREHVTLELDGEAIPATRYIYLPPDPLGGPIEITNFLVVPAQDQPFAADIAPVRRASRSRASAGLGSAQVQIIFDEGVPGREERDAIIDHVMEEIGPSVQLIAGGPQKETRDER